jgi:hypothetical protein
MSMMTTGSSAFPNSPRLARGGLVLLDPGSGQLLKVISFQYNPDTLTRTLVPQGIGPEPGDRLEALRLKAPPQETIKVEAEIDATDALETPQATSADQTVATVGLLAYLSALELIITPPTSQLLTDDMLAQVGMIEIAPVEAPLTVFAWGRNRVAPVRLTEFSVTEHAFDTSLNPTRATVSLSMRVLTVYDLGFQVPGGLLYLLHQQTKERLATALPAATIGDLGLAAFPGV